jgi:hypothetical protein
MIGAYTEIKYVNKSLCQQSPTVQKYKSWSLSWVSLEGPVDPDPLNGINIYQGGYAKCPDPVASLPSCPYNGGVSYVWYYYAHHASTACGMPFSTGIVKIANATTGTHFFQVSKVGTQANFYVDEVLKNHRPWTDISTCWSGVAAAEWQNEMLNIGDQGGGPLSDHQDFGNNQYQTSTGWHPFNLPLSSDCPGNSYPAHWICKTSSNQADRFRSWDDRAP